MVSRRNFIKASTLATASMGRVSERAKTQRFIEALMSKGVPEEIITTAQAASEICE